MAGAFAALATACATLPEDTTTGTLPDPFGAPSTMPEAQPHTLIGDLLATQAKVRGAAAILVDGAIRDVDELVRRFVGATSVPIRPDPYLDSITSADPTHGSDDLPRWNEPRGTAAAIGAIAVARLPFPRLPRG